MAAAGTRSAHHAWKVEYSSKRRGVGNPGGRLSLNCGQSERVVLEQKRRNWEHSLRGGCLHLRYGPRSYIIFMDDGLRPVRYDIVLALEQLANADAKLGALIERVGPFALQVKSTHSPFEALLEAILYQQLHANAARAILGRLLAGFGDLHPQPEQLLAAPEEMLLAAGLSRSKLLSLRDLAARTLDGTVPSLAVIRRLSDEEVIERLSRVRGIGTWTAEMLLIFRLGRPDVFPATDYGVRKGYLLSFGRTKVGKPITADMLPKPEQMQRRAARWKPWRSVASWYLWRACELPPMQPGEQIQLS